MPLVRKGGSAPLSDDDPQVSVAVAALRTGSVEERWTAARSLAAFPDATAALGQALKIETDLNVREAIFTALSRIGGTFSFEALLPHLRSDDANLRTGALDALRAMPGTVAERLDSILHDADSDVRILACELAREAAPENATRLLLNVIETDLSVNVCAAAVEVLAEIGSPEALPSLVRCAERFPDEPFLHFAIKVASERIGPRTAPSHG